MQWDDGGKWTLEFLFRHNSVRRRLLLLPPEASLTTTVKFILGRRGPNIWSLKCFHFYFYIHSAFRGIFSVSLLIWTWPLSKVEALIYPSFAKLPLTNIFVNKWLFYLIKISHFIAIMSISWSIRIPTISNF